jgi:hypothetical protein
LLPAQKWTLGKASDSGSVCTYIHEMFLLQQRRSIDLQRIGDRMYICIYIYMQYVYRYVVWEMEEMDGGHAWHMHACRS